ncbi:MAG: hypothetical protein H7269_11580, partial [Cellulomonas sp.]|nr:hypothetical protein [Cellulomonas sp.]
MSLRPSTPRSTRGTARPTSRPAPSRRRPTPGSSRHPWSAEPHRRARMTAMGVPSGAASGARPDTPRRGAGVRELVGVMDLLRSPGGCPWDAAQTHESLVPFALEEAHEVAEAIETGDRVGMREELGDLLLQVVFHARVAQEHATDAFDLDDVARGVAAKLVRRHPHVFEADAEHGQAGTGDGSDPIADPDDDAAVAHARWDR